jgi:hypothetical protein
LYCLSFCDWWLLLTHLLSSNITFLSDSTQQFWRHSLIIDICKYGRTSKLYEWSLLKWSATCSPIVYVYLSSFSSQCLIGSILFILFMLILICSPMLSVSLEYTSSLVFDGDRFAHLLFSLCVLCLFTNAASVCWVHPSPVFDGVRVAYLFCVLLTCSSMFIIFVLYGFTNVVCVSWVQHSPVLDGVCVAHLFSLSLTCSPMLSVFLDITPSPDFDGIRVAHLFSLFLTCSPVFSVSREFTLPQFMMGSVLLIFFGLFLTWSPIFSVLLVHLRSLWWGPWCSSFLSLFLTCSPMLSVSLETTHGDKYYNYCCTCCPINICLYVLRSMLWRPLRLLGSSLPPFVCMTVDVLCLIFVYVCL